MKISTISFGRSAVQSRQLSRVLVSLLVIGLFSCSDNSTSPEPETEKLSSFDVSAPASVRAEDLFTITVSAVGNKGTNPFINFNGNVTLTVSSGDISPDNLALSAGTGSAEVTVSNAMGPVDISATDGSVTGSTAFAVLIDSIPGDPGTLAADNIPDIRYLADYRDFSESHPDLEGMPVSFNTIAIQFQPGTTVAEANALIDDIDAGIAGGIPGQGGIFPGVLTVKFPSTSHLEMINVLGTLRNNPIVLRVVQDLLLNPDFMPRDNSGDPEDWDWQVEPGGPNWNLEHIRAPQMWNLNNYLYKEGRRTKTLVLDTGFALTHRDVSYTNVTPAVVNLAHGTKVAGIIGADFNNELGIDGVNPFADMVAHATTYSPPPTASSCTHTRVASALQAVIHDLENYLYLHPDISLINISMGYNWGDSSVNIDARNNSAAQTIASTQGAMLAQILNYLDLIRPLPLIVVSAGNDSYAQAGFDKQFAAYSSPMANAAIEHGVDCIIVVEALSYEPQTEAGVSRYYFSNVDGHVSAPGKAIYSTTYGSRSYAPDDGTSFSAPHVTGLAGYLLALDPNLTFSQLRDLILSNTMPVSDASPCINAWASALDIDRIRNNDNILTRYCDVDDGTVDGNQRMDYVAGIPYTDLDADGDGYRGDGVVDMSDFRCWRDWLLQVEDDEFGSSDLDGGENHIKRDMNGDGIVSPGISENIYPYGDFNGDGVLCSVMESHVPGYILGEVSDLETFQFVFEDPHYRADELPDLIESIDITFDLSTAFRTGGGSIDLRVVTEQYHEVLHHRTATSGDPLQVLTISTDEGSFDLRMVHWGWDFLFLGVRLDLAPGGDIYLKPLALYDIDEKSGFLHTCDEVSSPPVIIFLEDIDISPGDRILFQAKGNYYMEPGYDTNRVIAVFSSSDELLDHSNLNRIPGALQTDAREYSTPHTMYCEGAPTDIPEDFLIQNAETVTVPPGSRYLFLGIPDCWYTDNQEGPQGLAMVITALAKED